MQIYLGIEGRKQGPYTVEIIKAKIAEGQIAGDTTVAWYQGCRDWIPLTQVPGISDPPASAANVPPPPPLPDIPSLPATRTVNPSDATGGIIPYKNPLALTAYYLGVFGLCPLIGLILAIPAVIFGIMGLKKFHANRIIRGNIHAWLGILLGAFSILYHVAVVIYIAYLDR